MHIQILDVDGTLTWSEKDYPFLEKNKTGYNVFSFWPLLSSTFSVNAIEFDKAVDEWNESMKHTPDHLKDKSSFDMMERTVQEFLYPYVQAADMVKKAEEITKNFLRHNVVQLNAVAYLNECLRKGVICVLTTGSYLDGLRGFVNELINQGYLENSPHLLLNGAEVDWQNRKLIRANVGQYKTDNFIETLRANNIQHYRVQAAFGDDPYINDKAILELGLPNGAFVIKAKRNEHGSFDPLYHHCSWDEFLYKYKEKILL